MERRKRIGRERKEAMVAKMKGFHKAEIAALATEREAWLAAERQRRGEANDGTIDDAILAALSQQARAAGFDTP